MACGQRVPAPTPGRRRRPPPAGGRGPVRRDRRPRSGGVRGAVGRDHPSIGRPPGQYGPRVAGRGRVACRFRATPRPLRRLARGRRPTPRVRHRTIRPGVVQPHRCLGRPRRGGRVPRHRRPRQPGGLQTAGAAVGGPVRRPSGRLEPAAGASGRTYRRATLAPSAARRRRGQRHGGRLQRTGQAAAWRDQRGGGPQRLRTGVTGDGRRGDAGAAPERGSGAHHGGGVHLSTQRRCSPVVHHGRVAAHPGAVPRRALPVGRSVAGGQTGVVGESGRRSRRGSGGRRSVPCGK